MRKIKKRNFFEHSNKRRSWSTRGQEEIVGFVMIVVIVAIVGIILLGIGIRNEGKDIEEEDSGEIYQFLESMMQYTTECATSYEPAYSSLGKLIEECYSNTAKSCVNGKLACDVLERDMKNILSSSWPTGEENTEKGYEFKSIYSSGEDSEEIIKIEEGSCEGGFRGSDYLSPAFPGTITSSLKLCY